MKRIKAHYGKNLPILVINIRVDIIKKRVETIFIKEDFQKDFIVNLIKEVQLKVNVLWY